MEFRGNLLVGFKTSVIPLDGSSVRSVLVVRLLLA